MRVLKHVHTVVERSLLDYTITVGKMYAEGYELDLTSRLCPDASIGLFTCHFNEYEEGEDLPAEDVDDAPKRGRRTSAKSEAKKQALLEKLGEV